MTGEDKEKKLAETMSIIKKQFGEGSIMKFGDVAVSKCSVIPTGSIGLDIALGIGGVPKGRIIEIYGSESAGKTTLAAHIVANAQKNGGKAAYIDAEHALDPGYFKRIGVDVDNLVISQPNSGEEALNIVEHLILSGVLDVIVVDSVAALVPKSELEGNIGDAHVGLQARMMSQALRKITGALSRSNTCIIFINQLRDKIGVMFGSPKTTTGGKALRFYASIRMEISRVKNITEPGADEPKVIGNHVRVRVIKNKMAPPCKTANFNIYYNRGICPYDSVLDIGLIAGIIERKGAWFVYDEDKKTQGRDSMRDKIKTDSSLYNKLVEGIHKKFLHVG